MASKAAIVAARQRRLAREAAIEDRNERIVAMRKSEMEVAEIAAQVGLSERQVGRVLRSAGLTNGERVYHPPYPQETWDAIEKFLREEQAPYTAASEIFGPNKDRIGERFPDLGWTREEAGRNQGQINGIMAKMKRVTYANSHR